jgi:transposase-like protein
MDKEAAILRRDLARVETGRGRRYPAELRARVVTWARRRRAAGASWEEIKRELGQKFDTVRRWCVDHGETKALVPVRVVATQVPSRTLSVVSPAGFRIDGLSAAEAAALLREIG